jgi:hypothetical protein
LHASPPQLHERTGEPIGFGPGAATLSPKNVGYAIPWPENRLPLGRFMH